MKTIALCLACFALGFTVCNVIYQVFFLLEQRDKKTGKPK